jgi:ribose transport system ATP-binding protein
MNVADEARPFVKARQLTMEFGGQRALDAVHMDILPGEVHGLVGENGSGKSTLIKILAGFHAPLAGTLEVAGQPIPLPLRPGQFRELGFAFVHQDLGLTPSLSVLENLIVDRVAQPRRWAVIRWRRELEHAAGLLERFDVPVDPRRLVANLKPVERALVAIVRAVHFSMDADKDRNIAQASDRLLVLDEPTVFLGRGEVEQLYQLIRRLVRQQAPRASVLLVSHDLDEVKQITDRTTVLRDGQVVDTVVTSKVPHEALIKMIVGRDLSVFSAPNRSEVAANPALRIEGLSTWTLQDVSLDLSAGEVLGLTGLLGAGYEEILYALYDGERTARAGRAILPGGREVQLEQTVPERAIENRIFLIPVDRLQQGCAPSLSIADNMTSPWLGHYFRGMFLRRRSMLAETRTHMTDFDVRPRDPGAEFARLSGGNQQKALLAKWLQVSPHVLLLHEPTHGVDVGARQQIWSMIANLGEGCAVLYAGSDYDELARVCHRVAIVSNGTVRRILSGGEVTKERITQECLAERSAFGPAAAPIQDSGLIKTPVHEDGGSAMARNDTGGGGGARTGLTAKEKAVATKPVRARLLPLDLAERLALPLAWVAIIIIFGTIKPSVFLTASNFETIFSSQAVLTVITLGLIVPMTAGDYDLSIASVAGLSAMILAVFNVLHGWPVGLAVLVALAAGLMVGVVNGFVTVIFGIESLIVTLGMGTFVAGLTLWISNSNTVSGISQNLVNPIVVWRFLGIPVEFYYALGVALILGYMMEFLPVGRRLLMVGRGREVARLSGMHVNRIRFLAFVCSGGIGAVGGVLLAGTSGAADPSSATGLLLPAFAAAFLGATAIFPGRFNVPGTLIAVYFLATGITGLQLLGAQTYVQNLFYGAALVGAVVFSQLTRRHRLRRASASLVRKEA